MSSVVCRKKEKKLATVIVGLFSLKENAPTKNYFLKQISFLFLGNWSKWDFLFSDFIVDINKNHEKLWIREINLNKMLIRNKL